MNKSGNYCQRKCSHNLFIVDLFIRMREETLRLTKTKNKSSLHVSVSKDCKNQLGCCDLLNTLKLGITTTILVPHNFN